MKSKEEIKELVLNLFRKTNSRSGHIIMMRTVYNLQYKLNPKEQDLFNESINELIHEELVTYEKDSPECLRLTDKGYDYIYKENEASIKLDKMNTEPQNKDDNGLSPIKILNQAISKVPFVKYALGIAGIGAAIAILRTFVTEESKIPVITILLMLGLMVLLYIFSVVATSKEKHIRNAGFTLIYFIVLITCVSCTLLITSVFFDFPKPINEIVK